MIRRGTSKIGSVAEIFNQVQARNQLRAHGCSVGWYVLWHLRRYMTVQQPEKKWDPPNYRTQRRPHSGKGPPADPGRWIPVPTLSRARLTATERLSRGQIRSVGVLTTRGYCLEQVVVRTPSKRTVLARVSCWSFGTVSELLGPVVFCLLTADVELVRWLWGEVAGGEEAPDGEGEAKCFPVQLQVMQVSDCNSAMQQQQQQQQEARVKGCRLSRITPLHLSLQGVP